eukprot:scaffold17154_cov86-Skeletonema_dohrnii-CCMP3373.AAC.4
MMLLRNALRSSLKIFFNMQCFYQQSIGVSAEQQSSRAREEDIFVTRSGLSRGAKKDRVYGGVYPQYVGVWN